MKTEMESHHHLSDRDMEIKSIPADVGKQEQVSKQRNEHVIHFDITHQLALKTDETHKKYLE